jgi:Zn-dependent protease
VNRLGVQVAMGVAAVMAIILHEISHGYAALALGDDTARRAGRLTLNPLRHIDPVGTILVPAILLILRTGFVFGWAKPVPVAAWKFKNPRRGMMLVACAGPAMNFFLAWLSALAIHGLTYLPGSPADRGIVVVLQAFIVFNLILGLFNLIPIPPLDGGRIIVGLLPEPLAMRWARLERLGILLVILLVFVLPRLAGPNPVGDALYTGLDWAYGVVLRLAGLHVVG